MAYQHGISVEEQATVMKKPTEGNSGLQVIFGTAPVHLLKEPEKAVNQLFLVKSYKEAVEKLGFSTDFAKYTLCQSIYANFKIFNNAPIVFCNVLNPEVHKSEVAEQTLPVRNKQATLAETGVLLQKLVVKAGDTTLSPETDYIAGFDAEGGVLITLLSSGASASATELKVSGVKIAPEKVTEADIIGGYDAVTGKETGIELVRQVFPKFGLTPGLLLAPMWSKYANVAAALEAKCKEINGLFSCEAVVDISTAEATKYDDVGKVKENYGLHDSHTILLWPMVAVNDLHFAYSAVYAAMTSNIDKVNGDIPSLSPSNKLLHVTAAILEDGTEVMLDEMQANELNGAGIVTIVNFNGLRAWGNNTAAYPGTVDPKDRWINCRRFFSWWENQFILDFHDKVDDNADYVLIESLVDAENIKGNSLVAQGKCAGARIEFEPKENPVEQILNGKIVFHQYLAQYTPAEYILNVLEFDPTMIETAIGGGN